MSPSVKLISVHVTEKCVYVYAEIDCDKHGSGCLACRKFKVIGRREGMDVEEALDHIRQWIAVFRGPDLP